MLDWRIRKLKRQLQESRFRLNHLNTDFAGPLYDMIFVATKDVWRMSTNGSCIYFDPDWLQKLGEVELDFILAHEVMHVSLGHLLSLMDDEEVDKYIAATKPEEEESLIETVSSIIRRIEDGKIRELLVAQMKVAANMYS